MCVARLVPLLRDLVRQALQLVVRRDEAVRNRVVNLLRRAAVDDHGRVLLKSSVNFTEPTPVTLSVAEKLLSLAHVVRGVLEVDADGPEGQALDPRDLQVVRDLDRPVASSITLPLPVNFRSPVTLKMP